MTEVTPIPQPADLVLLDARIIFFHFTGKIELYWKASNGDVTLNDEPIANTNDLFVLHTIARGIVGAQIAKAKAEKTE